MTRTLLLAMALATALALTYSSHPQPAQCAFCNPVPCFSGSQCNAGCKCVRSDPNPGTCLSID